MKASKSDIAYWYKEFNAFDTIVPGKTYVQALLANVNTKVRKAKGVSACQKVLNPKIHFNTGKCNFHRSKVMEPVFETRAKKLIAVGLVTLESWKVLLS